MSAGPLDIQWAACPRCKCWYIGTHICPMDYATETARERRVRLVAELAVALQNVQTFYAGVVSPDGYVAYALDHVRAAERAVDAEAQEATDAA